MIICLSVHKTRLCSGVVHLCGQQHQGAGFFGSNAVLLQLLGKVCIFGPRVKNNPPRI